MQAFNWWMPDEKRFSAHVSFAIWSAGRIPTTNGSSFEVSKRKTAGHFFRKSEGWIIYRNEPSIDVLTAQERVTVHRPTWEKTPFIIPPAKGSFFTFCFTNGKFCVGKEIGIQFRWSWGIAGPLCVSQVCAVIRSALRYRVRSTSYLCSNDFHRSCIWLHFLYMPKSIL